VWVAAISVHQRARQGWHSVMRTMPCLCVCGAARECACVHGNMEGAHSVLGSVVESSGQYKGVTWRGARARVARGLVCWGGGQWGGEVTTPGVVGVALTTLVFLGRAR
jgi:hypothetical protein